MNSMRSLAGSPVYEYENPAYRKSYNRRSAPVLRCYPANELSDSFPIDSRQNSNRVVYSVSEHVPLEDILEQLGVDLQTLHRTGTEYNHYQAHDRSFDCYSSRHRSRPKLVCYEASDQDTEYHCVKRSRSYPYDIDISRPVSPVMNSMNNVWNRIRPSPNPIQPSNSASNLNAQWQRMRNSLQSPPPSGQAMHNAWNHIEDAMHRPPSPGGTPNPALLSAWSRADAAVMNSPPGMGYGGNQSMSNAWNRIEGAMNRPPSPNQAMMNAWNRADAAVMNSPPGMGYGGNQSMPNAWNRIEGAMNRPSSPMGQNQSMLNAWNRIESAAQNPMYPSPPYVNPYPPNVNPHPMGQGSYPYNPPPYNMNSSFNPMNSYNANRGSPLPPAPQSFAGLLAQAQRQNLPYAGGF